jgi:hypothetical protein
VAWFGIVVFVAFSLGLAVFFRWDPERLPKRTLPGPLGQWQAEPVDEHGQVEERRWLVIAGGPFRRTRLVEQVRHRDSRSNEISSVEPERVVDRWYFG